MNLLCLPHSLCPHTAKRLPNARAGARTDRQTGWAPSEQHPGWPGDLQAACAQGGRDGGQGVKAAPRALPPRDPNVLPRGDPISWPPAPRCPGAAQGGPFLESPSLLRRGAGG